jgi:hypothetical protein
MTPESWASADHPIWTDPAQLGKQPPLFFITLRLPILFPLADRFRAKHKPL